MRAQILDGRGGCRWVDAEALGIAYRFCALSAETLFLAARFRLQAGRPAEILERMRQYNRQRSMSQPLGFASAGSTFKNPRQGQKAWQS